MSQQSKSMADWLALFSQADIPVLQLTARDLKRLQEDDDQCDARNVANVVTDDPLMTVKLLRYIQTHKRRSQQQELVDVKQMLLMMGLGTFFRELPAEPLVEDLLRGKVGALVHLLKTVRRAQRSANFAFDWALRQHDMHAQEVLVSTLLFHVSEMLMWCFNPEQMLEIDALLTANPGMRSADAQRQVMGFAGAELQRQLVAAWDLPELLQQLMDPKYANTPRVRTVRLAVNLARHSAKGWDDAALPDDYKEIGKLLRMEPEQVVPLLKFIEGDAQT